MALNYTAQDLLENPSLFQEFINNITSAVEDAAVTGGSDAVGDTYTLGATDGDGIVTLNLDAATGTDSNVVFEGGTDISVNYTDDKLIISYTAGGEEGNFVTVDTTTGEIGDGTNTFQYLYQYLHTRFSASSNGASFVVDPNDVTGSTIYIGLANRSSMTAPTEAASYNWTEFTWSSLHNVFYRTTGGNRINFLTSTQSSVGDAVLFASGDSPIDFNVLMINTGNIVDAAITTTKILNDAITTPKILANAITSVKITADAITTDKIAASAVTATEIATDAITADKVAAGAITADKLTVVATEIPGATYLNKIDLDVDNLGGGTGVIDASGTFIDFGQWLMFTDQDTDQGQNQGTPYVNGSEWSVIKQIRERGLNNNVGFSNNDGFVIVSTSLTQWCIFAVKVLFENALNNVSAYNVLGIVDYAGALPDRGTTTNLQFATTLRALGGVSSELDTGLQASDFGASGTTVIDGGRITTGTLSTDRIATGSLDVDKIDAASGTFQTANIPDLNASKITAGTINADRIAAGSLDVDKIDATSGNFDVANIPDLNASKITAGTIGADRIATNSITIGKIDQTSGTFDTDTIPNLSADKITSGTLNATLIADGTITTSQINAASGTFQSANIPNLDANKITTGSLNADRIAANSISTTKIDATSAAFDSALIPNLAATKITSGTLDANRIAAGSITANKIDATSGTFATANIPDLSADKITSGTIDVGLLAADTAYITNSAQVGDGVIIAGNIGNDAVTSTQIADGAITTSAIAAGAISADKINAGTITADKLILDGNVLEADGSNLTVKDKGITNSLLGDDSVGTSNIATNAVTADAIAANAVTADAISVANLAAISATLGNVDIDSARINSGVINTARIPNLDANKITSGTIDANRLNISNTDVSGLGALATQDSVTSSEVFGIEYASKLAVDSESLGGGIVTIDGQETFISFGQWLMFTDQDTDQGNSQGTPYTNGAAWSDIKQVRERATVSGIGFSDNNGFIFTHSSDTQWCVFAVDVLFENGIDNISAYNVVGIVDSMGVTPNRNTNPNLQFATTLKGLGGISAIIDTGPSDSDLALKVNVDLTNAPAGILNSNVSGQTKASLGVSTIYNQNLLPSTGVLEGDIWYDTNDSNKMYVAQNDTPTFIGDAGWKLFDPGANINNTTTTIDGGKITTGTLNTDRLNASSAAIATALIPDLNASKITAGTIDANRISITASNVTDLGALATEDNVTQSQVTGLSDTFNTKINVDLTNAPDSILNSNVEGQTKASLGVNSVFVQSGIPTGSVGDIWYDDDDNRKMYVAQSDGSNEISATEWLLFDPGANINNTTTTIDGGKLTTGTVNTDRINASSAAFATALIPDLNANKITAGTIDAARLNITATEVSGLGYQTKLDVDGTDLGGGAFTINAVNDTGFITSNTWAMFKSTNPNPGNSQNTDEYTNGDPWIDIREIRTRFFSGNNGLVGLLQSNGYFLVHTSDTQWAIYALEYISNGSGTYTYDVLGLVDSQGVIPNQGTIPTIQFATTVKGLSGVSGVLDTGATNAELTTGLGTKISIDLTNAPAGILNSNVEGQTKASLGVNSIYNQGTLPSTGVLIGDVWVNTSDSDKMYVAQVNAPSAIGNSGWKLFDPNANINNSSTTIDGGIITTGTVNTDRINASSAAFATALIPNLTASKITSGTLDPVRIPNLDASKITTGQLSASRIDVNNINIGGAQITSGTIDAARIPNLAVGTITGLGDLATQDTVSTDEVTGLGNLATKNTVTNTDIAANAVNSGAIQSGAVTSVKLADDIRSDNYVANTSGWNIERNTGDAEFNNVDIRGTSTINAANITSGVIDQARIPDLEVGTFSSGNLVVAAGTAPTSGTSGVKMDSEGNATLGNNLHYITIDSEDGVVISGLEFDGSDGAAFGGNTSLGHDAGSSITTGFQNVNLGYNAGKDITTGESNVNIGRDAGFVINTGSRNTNVGSLSGTSITTGERNTNIGRSSGRALTEGLGNTSLGYLAGRHTTTGDYNVAIGYLAGDNVITGNENVMIGRENEADAAATNLSAGIAIGTLNTIGHDNAIVIGHNLVSTEADETTIGGDVIRLGSDTSKLIISSDAEDHSGNKIDLTALASVDLNSNISIKITNDTLKYTYTNTSPLVSFSATSNNNVAVDDSVVIARGKGVVSNIIDSVLINSEVGRSSKRDVIIGDRALFKTPVSQDNVAIGYYALSGDDASISVVDGMTLSYPTRNSTTSVGFLQTTEWDVRSTRENFIASSVNFATWDDWVDNFFVTNNDSLGAITNATGLLYSMTIRMDSDNEMTFLGNVGTSTFGGYWVYIHSITDQKGTPPTSGTISLITNNRSINNLTHQKCTFVGAQSNLYPLIAVNSSGCFGYDAASYVNGDNQIRLGGPNQDSYIRDSMTALSDKRDKADIVDTPLGLDFVKALTPKQYRWNDRVDYFYDSDTGNVDSDGEIITERLFDSDGYIAETKKRNRFHQGLIAQEVYQVLVDKGLTGEDFGGYVDVGVNSGSNVEELGLRYEEFIAPLIKAVQEVDSKIPVHLNVAHANQVPLTGVINGSTMFVNGDIDVVVSAALTWRFKLGIWSYYDGWKHNGDYQGPVIIHNIT